MNLGSGRTVQLSVVALPEPPVHQNRYARACKGHLHRLDRSLQVRHEDCGQPVVATPLPERRCVVPPGVGEATRKPPSRYSLLVVLSGRVRFVDDLYGHDADIAHEAKELRRRESARPTNERGSGAFLSLYSEKRNARGNGYQLGFLVLAVATLSLRAACRWSIWAYRELSRSIPFHPLSGWPFTHTPHKRLLPEPSWIPRHQCALGAPRPPESKDPSEPAGPVPTTDRSPVRAT